MFDALSGVCFALYEFIVCPMTDQGRCCLTHLDGHSAVHSHDEKVWLWGQDKLRRSIRPSKLLDVVTEREVFLPESCGILLLLLGPRTTCQGRW